MRIRSWFLFASSVVVFGCSSGSAGSDAASAGGGAGASGSGAAGMGGMGAMGGAGSAGPGAALTLAQFCENVIAGESAWCDYLTKCCSTADKNDLNYFPPVCSTGPGMVGDCVSSHQKALDKGHVTFDGTWGETCIAEVAKSAPPAPTTCSGLHAVASVGQHHGYEAVDQIPACRSTFAGKLAVGAACEYTIECGSGLICGTGTGQAGGKFTCIAPGQTGTPCISRSDCALGLACVGATPRQCGKLGSVGDACIYASDCADGLLCNLTCKQPKQLGEKCGVSDVCGGVAGCSFQSSSCVSLKADGAACTTSGECDGRCDAATKTCTSICGGTI